jgi:hypothetical protein
MFSTAGSGSSSPLDGRGNEKLWLFDIGGSHNRMRETGAKSGFF